MQLRGVPGRAGRYGSCMGSHALISGLEGRRLRWALRLAAASAVAGIAGVTQAQPQLQSAPARVFDDRARARVLADEAANAYARGNFVRAELLLDHAYSIVPAPTVALLRARALVRLKRWVEAVRVYQTAASANIEAAEQPVFQRASEEAKAELALLEPR